MFLILIEIFKCLKDKTELVALTFLSTIRHFGANLQSNKLAVEKVAIIVNWYYQGNLNARKFFHSHNNKSTVFFCHSSKWFSNYAQNVRAITRSVFDLVLN